MCRLWAPRESTGPEALASLSGASLMGRLRILGARERRGILRLPAPRVLLEVTPPRFLNNPYSFQSDSITFLKCPVVLVR